MKSFMIKLLLLLFGSTLINAYSEHATKKDISHIPEAPILPPLNLNGLPHIDNAKAINEQVTGTSDIKTKDDFGDSKPEIESFDEMRHRTKTYGLSLKSGEGYSWNDINGGTDLYYKDDKISNEEHKEYNNEAQENAIPNHNVENEHSRPNYNENVGNGYSKPNDNLNLENHHPKPIDIQNPGNHYSRPIDNQNFGNDYSRPIDNQNFGTEYSKPNDNLNLENHHPKPIDIQNPGNDYSRPIKNQNLGNDYSRPIDNHNFGNEYSKPNDNLNFGNHPPGPIDNQNLSTDNSNIENSKGDEVSHENTTPESFERILNDDKFLEWFAEWIEFYYDVVSKYIENNIKEEVAKQISAKRYYNREDDRSRIDNDAKTIKIKILSDERNDNNHEKNLINYEDIVKRLVNEFKDSLNANNQNENQRENSIINREENEEVKNAKNVERENKDFKLGRVYKEIFGNHHDHKEVIETADEKGVELPKEDNSNRVEKGRPGNYSGGANYEVNGENIYGNSVGNDEVTNIYIFYPKESNDAVKNLIYSYSKNKEHYKRNDETHTYELDNHKSIDRTKKIDKKNVHDDEKYFGYDRFLKDEEKIKNIDKAEETIDVRSFGEENQQ